MVKRSVWSQVVQWVMILALPLALVTVNVRAVTGHWFVHWEYGKADFPADPYNLTSDERARLAEVCISYLATSADIDLLRDLRLPDGAVAFNARELQHMVDVQVVYDGISVAGLIAAVVFVVGLGVLGVTGRARNRCYIARAFLGGGLLTLGLLAGVGVFMLLNWNQFFDLFHRLFFAGDSWLFSYSDTLIRLFPIRFWMDVSYLIVGTLVVEAVAATVLGWVWRRRVVCADAS